MPMQPHHRKLQEDHRKEHNQEHHTQEFKLTSKRNSNRRLHGDTNKKGSPSKDPGDVRLSQSALEVQDQILAHLSPKSSLLHASVLARNDDPGPVDVIVPVFQTLKIKHLVDDLSLNEGEVAIIGTMVQRTLGVDLKDWRKSRDIVEGHFSYRVNERGGQMDNNFEVRKTVLAPMTSTNGDAGGLMARSTTLAVKLPTDRYTILDADPFCIMAVTCSLELTSTDGSTPGGCTQNEESNEEEKIEGKSSNVTLRPDLWAHVQDPRNLVTVKDDTDIDHCRCYDLVNPSPTIEFFYDKTDGRLYVPKMRITFFMEKYAYGNFFETLLPIIFCNLASTLNFIFNAGAGCKAEPSVNDFLDNSLTLGLTVIFLIPRLVQREAFVTTNFSLDDLFVLGVMASLILGLFPECIPGERGSGYLLRIPSLSILGSPELPCTQVLAMLIGWGSLGIPLYNFFLYRAERRRIMEAIPRPKDKDDATCDSFIGEPGSKKSRKPKGEKRPEGEENKEAKSTRPQSQQPQSQKKGSDICFEDLLPWYQWTQEGKVNVHPVIQENTEWYTGRWHFDANKSKRPVARGATIEGKIS